MEWAKNVWRKIFHGEDGENVQAVLMPKFSSVEGVNRICGRILRMVWAFWKSDKGELVIKIRKV